MTALVFTPLSLSRTSFAPPLGEAAPTEWGNRIEKGMVEALGLSFGLWRDEEVAMRGSCNDGNGYHYFGGAAGHAGIFSDARDLCALGRLYLDEGRLAGGTPYLDPALVREACTDRDTGRGLGFQFGENYPGCGFGHTGFTGTYLYLNKERDLAAAILTNRLNVPSPRKIIEYYQAMIGEILQIRAEAPFPPRLHGHRRGIYMAMHISPDYPSLSAAAALHIAAYIKTHPAALLCFAAGDTPLGILKELVGLQAEKRIDLASMYYVSLDEWIGLGYADAGSCRQVMQDAFYGPAGIPPDHVSVFDGLDADAAHQTEGALAFISEHGGIALALLGIGMNGHIGFNEPGTSPDFPGGLVALDETTRTVGKKYFNDPFRLEYGITLGIKTLMSAEELLLIANGDKKAGIIRKALVEEASTSVPASLLRHHPGFHVYLDSSAAALLK